MPGGVLNSSNGKVGKRIVSPNGIEWDIIRRYGPGLLLIKSTEAHGKVVALQSEGFCKWQVA